MYFGIVIRLNKGKLILHSCSADGKQNLRFVVVGFIFIFSVTGFTIAYFKFTRLVPSCLVAVLINT